jgi:hypothetical protein
MTDKKKDSEGTDQDKSDETAMDQKLDQIADKAARKGIESEQHFDEEHGIFTK